MALVQAIKEMPMINVQVDGHTIIKKKDINIGMASGGEVPSSSDCHKARPFGAD